MTLADLKIKIFADGANMADMVELYRDPHVQGFTTNPSLMRKAGVTDYQQFARDVLRTITDRPISFEVFADDFEEMERQARLIATWGPNIYVKIPVTNSVGRPSYELIHELAHSGVKVNITAMMTVGQVRAVSDVVADGAPCYLSMFAGRIADTGRDPLPIMEEAVQILRGNQRAELLWASSRELLNIFQANSIGCHIITVTKDILNKLSFIGKDLEQFSKETARTFYLDAAQAGYRL